VAKNNEIMGTNESPFQGKPDTITLPLLPTLPLCQNDLKYSVAKVAKLAKVAKWTIHCFYVLNVLLPEEQA